MNPKTLMAALSAVALALVSGWFAMRFHVAAASETAIPTFSTAEIGRQGHFYIGGHYVGEPGNETMHGAMYVEVWVPKNIRHPYPLVFITDPKNNQGDVISGGNFHGEPLAFALDFMAIALSALAGISARRIERLVNPALNEGLPPFLAPGAGLNSGFMMPQVTAAALVSENKVLAHPASVDSITTSGNKEDYVSMGMTAALKLRQVVENSRNVLAIEAMAVAQAIDFLAPLKTSRRGQAAHGAIRSVCPTMEKDRVMYLDLSRLADLIASGKIAEALR